MNTGIWQFWFTVGQTLAMGAIAFYTWMSARSKATRAALGELSQQVAVNERRVSVIEKQISMGPTHDDIGRIYKRLEAMNGELQRMNGSQEAQLRQLSLISEHLLRDRK